MFGSRPLQFTDWCTDFSVATDMVDPEAGTVAPLLLLDNGVVTLKVSVGTGAYPTEGGENVFPAG